MNWAHALQVSIAILLLIGSAYTWWPRKRNRHVTLPPPSPQCQRNSVESVP
jgi:hypothetical protein